MTTASDLVAGIATAISYGEQVCFKYYTQTHIGEYDDDVKLTQSGTDFWCSGLVMPIDNRNGSNDSLLMTQGKVLLDDKKVYVAGDVQTSGLGPIKIGMNGSPSTQQYQIVEDGQNTEWDLNGSSIYKKLYIRYLNNGTFIGE